MEGGERRADLDYPDEQYFYFRMADRFGWTPDQVDNLPVGVANWLIPISDTVEQVKAERSNS